MTHFDVAPTLLQAAGFAEAERLAMGTSAFARSGDEDPGRLSRLDVARAPALLLTEDSARDTGVMISRQDVTFGVGDYAILASDAGRTIDSGLFVLLLNEQGNVTDTIFTRDSGAMLQELEGRFVVGVSLYGDQRYRGDEYFFGWMSQEPGALVVRPFDADVHISPVYIVAGLERGRP
jgi:hypothetical protein